MRFNKQIIVILVLISLLISAIGAALFLYSENEKTKKVNTQRVTVFIAKRNIKKNSLIKSSDLVKTSVAKRFLLGRPLLQNEIVDKFAKTTIYKNEMFRSEKLSNKIIVPKTKKLDMKYNSYNADFKLFKNPNYSLVKGDTINIVSVHSNNKESLKYNVDYIAKDVVLLGFLERGKFVEKAFRESKKKVKSKKSKKSKVELVKTFADEMVLDLPDEKILLMIDEYNKGKQLWMVKTDPRIKKVGKKNNEGHLEIEPTEFPYKLYSTNDLTHTKQAIIEYEDGGIAPISEEITVSKHKGKVCNEKQLLIGIAKKVMLRRGPSFNRIVDKTLHRNRIMPYVKKVGDDWYELCDGKYVHTNEVNEISYNKAQSLLNAKHK